ncbi:glypican-5-like isoform X2 [Rhinoderma darwinii]|uniref:glypican-5-like isoform X2 n=1 Tax=Rhinoderma darwinii TaxID=43563 RepID=UPI003F67E9A8
MPMLLLPLLLLFSLVPSIPSEHPPSCHEVRAAFQIELSGKVQLVPAVPIEERLTYLIDMATNNTLSLFDSKYRSMAQDVHESVKELFTDLSLNIMGADMPLEDVFSRFWDALFPLVYNHLINPGVVSLSEDYLDCLRLTRQDINPFGNNSNEMLAHLSKSLWASRMMKQALSLAEQVINSTMSADLTRECIHAQVRMRYCPHCQGLTLIRPCVGYCLNVMRGCLASLASLDGHWKDFFNLLKHLADQMSGPHDLEQSLLEIRDVVKQSIQYAESQGPYLSRMVEKVCGELQESPHKQLSEQKTMKDEEVEPTPAAKLQSLGLRTSDFIDHMKPLSLFFTALAERLCDREIAVRDGSTCWNGENVAESYTKFVVSSDFKDQVNNSEVYVGGFSSVINQVINKMRLFIQMASEKRIKAERWRITEGSGGYGRSQGEDASGDCDDEDGCQGSGENLDPDVKKSTDKSGKVNLTMKDPVHLNPSATGIPPKQRNSSDATSRSHGSLALIVAALFITSQFISQDEQEERA